MSREALSLDISRLVSRVVAGESIDIPERGAALAAKYPDLGMSGQLIGQAIERAAGMVGMIRNAPEPAKLAPVAKLEPVAKDEVAVKPVAASVSVSSRQEARPVRVAPAIPPVTARSIEDELAAAIDFEIGNLVSGHRAPAAAVSETYGDADAGRRNRDVVARPESAHANGGTHANGSRHTAAVAAKGETQVQASVTAPPGDDLEAQFATLWADREREAPAPPPAAQVARRPAENSFFSKGPVAALRRALFRT